MNKAITDGVVLTPPKFADGLDVWSSGDGTPGSDTYDGAANAAFVPADQDFGGCLELAKTQSTQKLRYMGETPLLPGCYLRVTARVKAISGNLPSVRIAAWAGGAGGAHVSGLTEIGASESLNTYGEIVEVSAIVGAGQRNGVDMVWGPDPIYGHFGIDLTGQNGGVVRVDDIEIEDITHVFHRDMMNWVDVRDYGAIGDGVTDDHAAFEAADAAANGRRVMISKGTYRIESSLSMSSPMLFEGTLDMPDDAILSLNKEFHLPAYISAFGNEQRGFEKAFQAMLNSGDHDSLDMRGRTVTVNEPLNLQAIVGNKTSYQTRRVIRNGQFYAASDTVWDPDVVTSQATYNTSNAHRLTGVTNVANIPIGARVEGSGVGREVYVRDVNVAAQEVTLSNPLFGGSGTRTYTFTRYKYILDFNGFVRLDKFVLEDVELQCNGKANGVILADSGVGFHIKDCFVTKPKHRCITSPGTGCQGMLVDRCNFITHEAQDVATARQSIVINTNGNDVKLRNNRSTQFRHFAVIAGSNSIVIGNHMFQGDSVHAGVRMAGIVLTKNYNSATIASNYIDNCFIEWTNEQDPTPDDSGFSFSALTIANNVFLSGNVSQQFSYIVVKPYGSGQYLNGVSVRGNMFRSTEGSIDRAERVDTTYADLDYSRCKDVDFSGNTFHNVTNRASNPVIKTHDQNSVSRTWVVSGSSELAFGGRALNVDSVVARGSITNSSNVRQYDMPYVDLEQGSNGDRVHVVWPTDVKGEATVTFRMDQPS